MRHVFSFLQTVVVVFVAGQAGYAFPGTLGLVLLLAFLQGLENAFTASQGVSDDKS